MPADRIPRDTARRTTCLQTVSLGTQHAALHACGPYPQGHSTPHYMPAVGRKRCCSYIHSDIGLRVLKVSHKERLACPLQFAVFWDIDSPINKCVQNMDNRSTVEELSSILRGLFCGANSVAKICWIGGRQTNMECI